MPPSATHIVVLAAGQGKRMHSALPKVLHPLAGRPLLGARARRGARRSRPDRIAVVVGHGADAVREAVAAPDVVFVTQDPPRGTGDAVRVALAALPGDGVTARDLRRRSAGARGGDAGTRRAGARRPARRC